MPNNEIKFLVKKETYTFILCSTCQGTNTTTRRFQGHVFTDPCRTCKGTGREKLIHGTEVSLIEALKELNLIK